MAIRNTDPGRIEQLVQAYLLADYRWALDASWHRLRIGQAAVEAEHAHPDAATFGVVTAWNPASIVRPEQENRIADRVLHESLIVTGLSIRPAFARAHDNRWREPGWLVMDMPAAAFDALAHRHGQTGTLFWRRGEPVQLRMAVPRPTGIDPLPWVQWQPRSTDR